MNKARAIIFDCDGVLVDSEPIAAQVLAECFREYEISIQPKELLERYAGKPTQASIDEISSRFGQKLPQSFLSSYYERRAVRFVQELRAMAGAVQCLAAFRGHGYSVAAATQASRAKAIASLTTVGLSEFFGSNIFAAEQVRYGKPAPDLFLLAAAAVGVEPAKCIAIDDRLDGIVGALDAGMHAVGFDFSGGRLQEAVLRRMGISIRTCSTLVGFASSVLNESDGSL